MRYTPRVEHPLADVAASDVPARAEMSCEPSQNSPIRTAMTTVSSLSATSPARAAVLVETAFRDRPRIMISPSLKVSARTFSADRRAISHIRTGRPGAGTTGGRTRPDQRPSEGAVQIDTPTGETVRVLALAGLDISAMAHARLNATSLVCTSDGTLILFREGQEAHIVELKLDHEMIVDAAISDHGEIAACVTTGGNVFGMRTTSGSIETFQMHVGGTLPVMRIGVSHTGSRLLVAMIDGTVSFYDATTLGLTRTLSPLEHYAGIEHVAFAWSDDERSLAVASANGLIHVIDLESETCVRTVRLNLPQSASRMTALAISCDRQVAVSSNTFFDILMLDMNTGLETGRLEGHTGIVRSIEFSPDEQRLYSGSYDGSVREWRPEGLQFVRMVD